METLEKTFTEATDRQTLLLDGGMATEIDSRIGRHDKMPYELLSLTRSDLIRDIHQSYIKAGADIISTNTFQANLPCFRSHCLSEGLVDEVNYRSALIASELRHRFALCENRRIRVAGTVGPIRIDKSSDIGEMAEKSYSCQIKALIRGGVDILLIESVLDLESMEIALKAISNLDKEIPVIVSVAINKMDGRLYSGHSIEQFVEKIEKLNSDGSIAAIGVNCGEGPKVAFQYLAMIAQYTSMPLCCHPSAGLPDRNGCYRWEPERFAKAFSPMLKSGRLKIAGGCCGTTPDHISALKKIIRQADADKSEHR